MDILNQFVIIEAISNLYSYIFIETMLEQILAIKIEPISNKTNKKWDSYQPRLSRNMIGGCPLEQLVIYEKISELTMTY